MSETQKYQIIFSSELEVDIDEFARDWNSDDACGKLAMAQTEHPVGGRQFVDFSNEFMMVLSTIGEILAGGVLYDVVKEPIRQMMKKKYSTPVNVELIPSKQPGGIDRIVVKPLYQGKAPIKRR